MRERRGRRGRGEAGEGDEDKTRARSEKREARETKREAEGDEKRRSAHGGAGQADDHTEKRGGGVHGGTKDTELRNMRGKVIKGRIDDPHKVAKVSLYTSEPVPTVTVRDRAYEVSRGER
jgi:hypothetical protein